MRTFKSAILLAAFCFPALAQLESGSLTVTATRSIALQPDQAVIGTSVFSFVSDSLEEVLATVADAGITEADLSDITVITRPTGPQLRWDFNLTVPLTGLNDKIASLHNMGLAFALRGLQVSTEKRASEQCPRTEMIADASAQARKMAVAAGVSVGSILSVAENGAIGGAVQAIVVPILASRTGDLSSLLLGTSFPPLPPSSPMVCSFVVKFGLGR